MAVIVTGAFSGETKGLVEGTQGVGYRFDGIDLINNILVKDILTIGENNTTIKT